MRQRRQHPPRPPELSARERILDAALDLLADRGVEGLSLRELGAQVGLHNSTLFHHFRDKADLVRKVVDAVAERHMEIAEPLRTEETPQLATLLDVAERWAGHFYDSPREARLLLRAYYEEADSRSADGEAPTTALRSVLDDWLSRAGAAGVVCDTPPAELARAVWAVLLFAPGAGPDAAGSGSEGRAQRQRAVRELVKRGLRPS